jgi:hypothetical protein
MNKDRRKRLRDICAEARQLLDRLDEIQQEEQDAVDNTPEGLQNTDRYARMEQDAETLEEESSNLLDIIESLEGML